MSEQELGKWELGGMHAGDAGERIIEKLGAMFPAWAAQRALMSPVMAQLYAEMEEFQMNVKVLGADWDLAKARAQELMTTLPYMTWPLARDQVLREIALGGWRDLT